jgi:hypothetical protein
MSSKFVWFSIISVIAVVGAALSSRNASSAARSVNDYVDSGQKPTSRPTLRIAAGNRLEFSQYAAANGSVYGPGAKLKINDIKLAWADVSDVVIDGVLEVKRTDPNTRVAAVIVANQITMNPGARIVTNGNVVWIFVNNFVSNNNAKIVAFEDQSRKATDGAAQYDQGASGGRDGEGGAPGPAGNPGLNGEGGGVVQIYASTFNGPIAIDLSGQNGGSGSAGGRGGNGHMGFQGENSEASTPFSCAHGGGGGGAGGNGAPGGVGGAAGRGGDGGVVGFFYVNSTTVNPPTNPVISVNSGAAGTPGTGGQGGTGGEGGLGGSGGGPCGGGPRGTWGTNGGSQGSGAPGAPAVAGSSSLVRLAAAAKIQEQFARATAQ